MSKKYSVKKANQLVKIEEKMSKAAQLWVSYLVACLPKAKAGVDDFPTLQFTFKEVKQAINADGKKRIAKTDDVLAIGRELMKTPLWYENEKRRGYVAWLSEVSEDKTTDEPVFDFVFHPKLKPYLLNLENQYTIYNYFYRVCLSNNSMKMYEILKRYQYLGQIVLNIEKDIKEPLGLVGKYEKYYDFRRKVIDVAQKELAKFTDISFDYRVEEKQWNRAVSLFVVIHRNVPTDLPEPLIDFVKTNKALPEMANVVPPNEGQSMTAQIQHPALFAILTKIGGKEASISKLIATYGIEAIEYQTAHVRRKLKENDKIKDAFAWLIKALQEGYLDPVQEAKKKKRAMVTTQKKKEVQKEISEEQLKTLKSEKYNQEKSLVQKIFSKTPTLLEETIASLEKSSSTIRREIQKGKTPAMIFQNVRMQGIVITEVKKQFPKVFKSIEMDFANKKAELSK